MSELKHGFGAAKMNKDLDERIVPNGEYRDALNIEITTSEDSAGGTMQTLLGNRDIKDNNLLISPNLFSGQAKCVGSIADEKNNHIYYFVADTTNYTDYIMRYDSDTGDLIPVVVDKYQIEREIIADVISTSSDPKNYFIVEKTGGSGRNEDSIRPGMVIKTSDFTQDGSSIDIEFNEYYTVIQVEAIAGSTPQWKVTLDVSAPHYDIDTQGNLSNTFFTFGVSSSTTNSLGRPSRVVFRSERVLNFSVRGGNPAADYFPLITGINFIDGMLIWTDGKSEPKRIIVDNFIGDDTVKGKSGTHVSGEVHSFFNTYHPNEVLSSNPNGLIIFPTTVNPNSFNQDFRLRPDFLREEHITVIKKSPLHPPTLIMSNTSNNRITPNNTVVDLKSQTNDAVFTDFFGSNLNIGSIVNISFNGGADYLPGDLILLRKIDEFDPEDLSEYELIVEILDYENVAPYDARVRITWIQENPVNGFDPISNSPTPASFFSMLQQEKPLYEFKFPKFAFRYKYQDNQYSSYSPFSEVAFLPGEFDYIPKEGYNLGMVNTLRTVYITDFVTDSDGIPKDVVEIDILYKESNSTNIYKVKTVKYNDEEWLLEGSVVDTGIGNFAQYCRTTGRIQITSEMVRSAVASNQLLRPWDNVPRTAKAQEIVGNRIVYANYLQSYNL